MYFIKARTGHHLTFKSRESQNRNYTVSISKDDPIGFIGTGVMGNWMCQHLYLIRFIFICLKNIPSGSMLDSKNAQFTTGINQSSIFKP
jgi:hypothetical protein